MMLCLAPAEDLCPFPLSCPALLSLRLELLKESALLRRPSRSGSRSLRLLLEEAGAAMGTGAASAEDREIDLDGQERKKNAHASKHLVVVRTTYCTLTHLDLYDLSLSECGVFLLFCCWCCCSCRPEDFMEEYPLDPEVAAAAEEEDTRWLRSMVWNFLGGEEEEDVTAAGGAALWRTPLEEKEEDGVLERSCSGRPAERLNDRGKKRSM